MTLVATVGRNRNGALTVNRPVTCSLASETTLNAIAAGKRDGTLTVDQYFGLLGDSIRTHL
jgi:hypothetical protein